MVIMHWLSWKTICSTYMSKFHLVEQGRNVAECGVRIAPPHARTNECRKNSDKPPAANLQCRRCQRYA